jgi:polyphosphate kinase
METRTDKQNPTLSRDLSWLAFNYRVLQEAQDPRVPLLERVKFMAIFSSNLDEFFKVRVATLRRLLNLKKRTRERVLHHPSEELDMVLREVARQQREFGEVFRNNLQHELRAEGIFILNLPELTAEQTKLARQYFSEKLKSLLHAVLIADDPNHLFLKDQTVYLVVRLLQKNGMPLPEETYAVLEVPVKQHGSRFLTFPSSKGKNFVILIDDVIRLGLPELFPDYQVGEAHGIKISRDAELDMDEDISSNLMAKIQRSIKKREKGVPTRMLIDPGMSVNLLELLKKKVGVTSEEIIIGGIYHNFRDFFGFPQFNRPELYFPPAPPLPHPAFKPDTSVFDTIRQGETLLYYPYHAYEPVIRFFEEAATDPTVTAISITLYRVAHKSKIAKALALAAKNGKFVTVMVELKARFDEESNINWARKLEKAGAHVIYGVPGYKVHCKLALISRREENHVVNYAYLSTGNFNESTAKLYTDYGFFTTDTRLTKEMDQVFQFFLDQVPLKQTRHLLVAPFTLRKKLTHFIDQEIKLAEAKKPAYIILKLNSLQDERIINKLYEASQAGVKIELIIRGICTLIPGQKNLSENITVRSIVDRFLEHPRIYIFGNGGKEKMYLSSADWMSRNLNRRVEVAFPIYDPELVLQIRQHLILQLHDNVKARAINNHYLQNGGKPLQSQPATYALIRENTQKSS